MVSKLLSSANFFMSENTTDAATVKSLSMSSRKKVS